MSCVQTNEQITPVFNKENKLILNELMLSYPYFNEILDIYVDVTTCQLGAVIIYHSYPVLFFSEESSKLQVAEQLKKFANILLVPCIMVCTGHKKLLLVH